MKRFQQVLAAVALVAALTPGSSFAEDPKSNSLTVLPWSGAEVIS